MQRILTLVLVVTVLPASFVVVRAQDAATAPVSTARAANARPLVPVRLNADGNFRIAPPYVTDAAFTAKPDVPQGRVIRFTMNSAESKIFPTAPAGRGGRQGGARGEAAPPAPAEPPQHQSRDYQVAFTTDPEGRATFGVSSGAAAALTMAWLHPNLYRRVISYSGTVTRASAAEQSG